MTLRRPRSSSSERRCAPRGWRSGRPSSTTRSPRWSEVPWTGAERLPRRARGDARQVARGPAHLRPRVRALLLPRRRGGGAAPRGPRGRPARTASPAASGSSSTTCASSCCRRSATATTPRCATSRGSRSPRSGAAARAPACSASTCSASAARSACARSPAGRCRRTSPREQLRLTREQIRRFEAHLRRELERAQIERTQALPPSRPLTELDRALPTGPLQDLAAVHRVVAQLKRRLATQGHETRGRKRHAHVDVRRTMRASLQTGGVPVVLEVPPAAPAPPRAVRAVRRLDLGHQRLRVLPLRPARAARRVPQDALVRVRRADLRGHRRLRARALVPRRLRGDLQGRRRRRRLRLHRLRPRVERVPASRSRTTCTRARP